MMVTRGLGQGKCRLAIQREFIVKSKFGPMNKFHRSDI
jgi:hypothetical protein